MLTSDKIDFKTIKTFYDKRIFKNYKFIGTLQQSPKIHEAKLTIGRRSRQLSNRVADLHSPLSIRNRTNIHKTEERE